MKNKIFAAAILSLLFILSSCTAANAASEARKQADIVLEAFRTGETEELKSLFCKKIADSYDLDTQLNEAIAFIDGNIINEGKPEAITESGHSSRNGEVIESHIDPGINDLETDTGKKYYIVFNSHVICAKDPDLVGMTYLTVYEKDEDIKNCNAWKSYQVGEYVS